MFIIHFENCGSHEVIYSLTCLFIRQTLACARRERPRQSALPGQETLPLLIQRQRLRTTHKAPSVHSMPLRLRFQPESRAIICMTPGMLLCVFSAAYHGQPFESVNTRLEQNFESPQRYLCHCSLICMTWHQNSLADIITGCFVIRGFLISARVRQPNPLSHDVFGFCEGTKKHLKL